MTMKRILLRAFVPFAVMMISTASSSSSTPSTPPCCFATTRSIRRAPFSSTTTTTTTATQSSSGFLGKTVRFIPPAVRKSSSSTELSMFMGSDGGLLGVGAPEVALIVLVGYFVLGPSELYKLTKEIGKFIQNIRTLGVEATSSFESSMEENLQMNEIRKAQRELNDAFSFRRSINYDDEDDVAFGDRPAATAASVAVEETAGAGAATTTTTKKKKRRRVKKKKVVQNEEEEAAYDFAANGQIPDLDMSSAFENAKTPEELAREERLARLESGTQPSTTPDWFESAPGYESMSDTAVPPPPPSSESDVSTGSSSAAAEQERFAKQMSATWNEQILANEDKLSPLSQIMERLAILEEERMAASARIEEEYRKKTEMEEEFYRRKKELLEEAAQDISIKAFAEQEAAAAEEEEEEAAKKEEIDLNKEETKKEEEKKKEVVSSEAKE